MKSKITIAFALLTLFQFSNVQAAPIDGELAVLASEQIQEEQPTVKESASTPTPKSKKELEAEEKRLREEKRAEEKRIRQEKEAARKQIEEGRKEQIGLYDRKPTSRTQRSSQRSTTSEKDVVKTAAIESNLKPAPSVESGVTKVDTLQTPVIKSLNPTQNSQPDLNFKPMASTNASVPNPMVSHATFEEVTKAVGFTPLYLPKKSGYTVNAIWSINGRIAEIQYGRRWEKNVSLNVRTYKRSPNEELQDISGVYGVKWRIDTTSGMTVYIAKIDDNTSAAAWAVGDYTFSAYAKNISFAAFHALVIEEMVDLSIHYYS